MARIRPEVTGRRRAGRSRQRLVYTVVEAGRLLGLGRNAAYEAAKRGDIPTIRMGRLLLVPKAPLHKLVGAEVPRMSMSEKEDESSGAVERLEEAAASGTKAARTKEGGLE
jgi:excisionase family DNA binding protein